MRTGLMVGCLIPLAQIWIAVTYADTTAPPLTTGAANPQSSPAPGLAGGPASWSNWLIPNVVLGSLELGPLILQPTLNLQLDGFSEVNNGWGGQHKPPIQDSEHFFEQSNEEGLNGRFDPDHLGELSGRISGIFDMTGGGLNAAATNDGQIQNDNYSIEDAYLKWSSGDMFPRLGYNAVQLIGGRYTYRIGDGFLFYNGASGGGNRAAPWLAPHHAFAQSGILRLDSHHILLEGFYLSPNDHPSTGTSSP